MTLLVDFIAKRPGDTFKSFGRNRFLFPLIFFQKTLREHNIHIRFLENSSKVLDLAGQILCLDSRVFTNANGHVEQSTLEMLSGWRDRYDWIVWFDNRDSSGTTQFEVLPFVDRYAKKQLIRDRMLYMKPFYGGRIYTNFIYNKYNICDSAASESPILITNLDDIPKLVLSWNLAYSDYRSERHWQRYINFGLGFRPPVFYSEQNKTIDIQARFGTDYKSDVIAYHRRCFLNLAKEFQKRGLTVAYGRIPTSLYKRELKHTLTVLSPFGWGEVCFRDFEAMQNGCALLKPSVEHLETWPDLFTDSKTYIALSWDFEKAQTQIAQIFDNPTVLQRIGLQGQEAFKKIWGNQGAENFVKHFLSLVTPGTQSP